MGEATRGVLCPVLGSAVKKQHRHTGENPAKAHKDDEGTGAPHIGGKAESYDCSAWRRRGSGGILSMYTNT